MARAFFVIASSPASEPAIARGPRHAGHRLRALAALVLLLALGASILVLVPLPQHTAAQGVVWLPEHAHLRAGAEGFVSAVHASSPSHVTSTSYAHLRSVASSTRRDTVSSSAISTRLMSAATDRSSSTTGPIALNSSASLVNHPAVSRLGAAPR